MGDFLRVGGVEASSSLLNSYYRPYKNIDGTASTIYFATTGSDTSGDGTSGNPYATILKCILSVGTTNPAKITLQALDEGPFDIPQGIVNGNFLTIVGTETIEDSRTISAVTVTARTGVRFTVSGATLADDEWRDRHLSITGVLSNARNIVVRRNVGNVIYGCMYNRNIVNDTQSNPNGGTANLLAFTELQLTGPTYFLGNFQLNFQNVKVVGDVAAQNIFLNGTDKVEFWKTQIEIQQFNTGRGGGLYVFSSSMANYGSGNGVFQIRTRGDARLGNSLVFSDRNSGAGFNFLNIQESSILGFQGLTFFRGLDDLGIQIDGASCTPITESGSTGKVVFDNDTADISNVAAFKINPNTRVTGQFYGIPESVGEIDADYLVEAQLDANVVIASGTSVVTNLGTNTVSADGGVTASSIAADGTRIIGGTPSFSAGFGSTLITTTTPLTVDATLYEKFFIDSTAGAKVSNLPAANSLTKGATVLFKDYAGTFAANTLTINPAGADTIDNVAAALVLNVNNQFTTLTTDGISNWSVT